MGALKSGGSSPAGLHPPAPLAAEHDLADFECGAAALDDWLRNRAFANQEDGASRTYVLCTHRTVVGYYCLAAGAALRGEATGRVRRNMPEPVPVMVLGRLAVDRRWQGQGLGRALLRDAVLRTMRAADIAGIRAILVHAKDEAAARFYEQAGIVRSPVRPLTLMVPLQDLRERAKT